MIFRSMILQNSKVDFICSLGFLEPSYYFFFLLEQLIRDLELVKVPIFVEFKLFHEG